MSKPKQNCHNFINVLYIINLKWVHCISIYILNSVVSWSIFTASSLFGYDTTSFAHLHFTIICHLSPHLFTSQAISGWMGADAHFQVSPEMFDWVYSQAVAGQLKDIYRVVYKLLCTLDHCPVRRWTTQSEVLNALDWVFIKAISIFWCIKLFFYFDMSFSPCWRKTPQQHGAATSTLYFWDGTLQVMSRAGSLQAWFLEMKFIRPENIFSHRVLLGLFICVQITSGFHVFSLRRGLNLTTPP